MLPKLNDTPQYQIKVPSTGQMVRFRPYLVKEEKVMMLAFESQDVRTALEAVASTIASCVPDINVDALAAFDIEYLFLQIRSKSVGETADLRFKCAGEQCDHEIPIKIDLSDITLQGDASNQTIQLTDKLAVELQYPRYRTLIEKGAVDGTITSDIAFDIIVNCIVAVLTDAERIDTTSTTQEELTQFVESMTSAQFKAIVDFVESQPKLVKDLEFRCPKCQHNNKVHLEGMSDFFT